MMLLFLVFFPMAAAVCSYLIGRKDKKLRDHAVQIFCLIEFAVAAAAMGLVVAGKELSAARIAPGVSSCATHVYEVKLIISKKMNVVNRSAERNTPTVAPCVSRKKK